MFKLWKNNLRLMVYILVLKIDYKYTIYTNKLRCRNLELKATTNYHEGKLRGVQHEIN